jgi:dihydrofolate synthase / folylpolyglutamate synthase
MNMLGDTLPLIAGEKAGIIKPNVPVVIGETHPESAPVFRTTAAERQAPITFADQTLQTSYKHTAADGRAIYDVHTPSGQPVLEGIVTDAAGPFQRYNINTATCAIRVLDQLGQLPPLMPHLRRSWGDLRGLVRFQGRWQILGQRPLTLADSAHNEGGLRIAFDFIKSLTFSKLHIVTGFVNDKDVNGVLPLFPKQAKYYFAKADIPRGLPADELRDLAQTHQLNGRAYASVRHALRAARRAAAPDDLIVIIGSIFVVAEVI